MPPKDTSADQDLTSYRARTAGPLVLGPLMRHVDETSASIWVETASAATVRVRCEEREWSAATFGAHGHHYALVEVDGLAPGSVTAYSVDVDDVAAWPEPESPFPASVIATLKPGKPLRLAFGSCRTSVGHDTEGNRMHGVDALRAMALRMARSEGVVAARQGPPEHRWPDLCLFLGDQVYADETTREMRDFITARRDIEESPGTELRDFEEYAHLYTLAWSDPANRWLLSTLPVAMIFDDHDVRDDWNTSQVWKDEMQTTDWWQQRVVAGLGSYWVYQHLGNLSNAERSQDPLWQRVAEHAATAPGDELDLTEALDDLATRVDEDPEVYRFSYSRDVADVRLIVVDTRAARVLETGKRALLDGSELHWLDQQMTGGYRHLLVGSSLPFLMPPGLHHLEAWDEAVAAGAWGSGMARFGEWARQAVDLEHWPAWQQSFTAVATMVLAVAEGLRGPAPRTVTFLSGDVHHSYVSEVRRDSGSRIVQAVCSPIRNPLSRIWRFVTALLAYAIAGPLGRLVSRTAHVSRPPFTWRRLKGPWFDNAIAVLEDREEGLWMRWEKGVQGRRDTDSYLRLVDEVLIEPRG